MKIRIPAMCLLAALFLCSCGFPSPCWEERRVLRNTKKSSVDIAYPQMSPPAQWEEINRLLESYALCNLPPVEENGGTATMNYQVLRQAGYVSVLFEGSYYVQGTPHPTVTRRAVTFDPSGKSQIRLADVVKIDSAFVERVRQAARSHADREIRWYFAGLSGQEWMQILLQCDEGMDAPAYSIPEKAGVRLLLEVPHPLGDVAELEVPFP